MRCSKETEHLFQKRLQDKGWKAPKPTSIQVWPPAAAATLVPIPRSTARSLLSVRVEPQSLWEVSACARTTIHQRKIISTVPSPPH